MEEISIGEFSRRSRLSPKALRLYDELGVLVPWRVDQVSGYRYYDVGQLDQARLVAMLRQLQMPLAEIKELLACDPAEAAGRIAAHWRQAEAVHDARRQLAGHLVDRLRGKGTVMYEVATREMPERSLLCLKRHVDEPGQWSLGKEFIGIFRQRPVPRMEGRPGAMFCIWWGEVNADSDGPIEFCKPVPPAEAQALAAHYPELTLRTEAAHHEAFIAFGPYREVDTIHWQLVSDTLQGWAMEHGLSPGRLALSPEDLGLRVTYLVTPPVSETSVPDCDFAVPFA